MQTKFLLLSVLGGLLLTGFRPVDNVANDKHERIAFKIVRKGTNSLYLECSLLYAGPLGDLGIGNDNFSVNGSNLVMESAARFTAFALKRGYVYTVTTWFYQNTGKNLDPLKSWNDNGVNAGENDLEIFGTAVKL